MSVSREALPTGTDSAQALRTLLMVPVRVMRTAVGRRVVAAAALAIALQGMVGLMFSNADAPTATAGAAVREASVRAGQGTTHAAAHQPAAPAKASASKKAAPKTYAKPQEAAAAWFAKQAGVPVSKVRALQQRPAGENKAKVLVMAEYGDNVDTDEVTVVRGDAGWRVR
jgi:hypothetical protein